MPFTLLQILNRSDQLQISENDVEVLMSNLLKSLSFVHDHNVMHRDVKPANILVDQELNVKLCDFGLARTMEQDERQILVTKGELQTEHLPEEGKLKTRPKRRLSSHVVSRFYRPPEIVMAQSRYDEKVDLWSAGCILQEMILCQRNYKQYVNSDQRIMFPASSCYPLSPKEDSTGPVEGDLLTIICRILGKLTEE
mmetsp:Transcript_19393/g.29770  ORF Transcript_19393/g.29770 Transcript_19393/m.29770 type:complete len:196 (-) Transcript_19393:442-1029(-)